MSINLSDNNFPNEMIIKIFSYLEPKDLASCEQVNQRLQRIITTSVWPLLFERLFPGNDISSKEPSAIKEMVVYHHKFSVSSFQDMAARFKKFESQVPLDKTGKFTCKFFNDNSSSFTIYLSTIGLENLIEDENDWEFKDLCILRQPKNASGGCYSRYMSNTHYYTTIASSWPCNNKIENSILEILRDRPNRESLLMKIQNLFRFYI